MLPARFALPLNSRSVHGLVVYHVVQQLSFRQLRWLN